MERFLVVHGLGDQVSAEYKQQAGDVFVGENNALMRSIGTIGVQGYKVRFERYDGAYLEVERALSPRRSPFTQVKYNKDMVWTEYVEPRLDLLGTQQPTVKVLEEPQLEGGLSRHMLGTKIDMEMPEGSGLMDGVVEMFRRGVISPRTVLSERPYQEAGELLEVLADVMQEVLDAPHDWMSAPEGFR